MQLICRDGRKILASKLEIQAGVALRRFSATNDQAMLMKPTEKQLHLLFKIGVWSKGIDGALEALAGFALLFTTPASLRHLIDWLTQGELQEDPNDFIATHLVDFFHQLSFSTKHFVSAYLLVYGITKIGLAASLLRGKLWAYPFALGVLGLFLCYQVYRLSHNHSMGLGFVSVLDLIVIVLIWRDYQYLKATRLEKDQPQPIKN